MKAEPLIYATRQALAMSALRKHPIIIFLIGFALLAPVFAAFDSTKDLEQGTDFVFLLLCAFVSMGLFLLCKRIALLVQLVLIAIRHSEAPIAYRNRSIQVEVSPPECLLAFVSLRI